MELRIDELEQIFKTVIQYLQLCNINEISFPNEDFYVEVWDEHQDFDNPEFLKCPPHVIGSLDEEMEWLKQDTLHDSDEYGLTGVHLRWLGAILTAFGQTSAAFGTSPRIKNPAFRKTKPPKLTIDELSTIFDRVIKYLKIMFALPEIFFENKHYIKIDCKSEYLGIECPPYTIGSLDDDIRIWKKILLGESEPSAIDLERLGAISTALGEQLIR